MNWIPSLKQAGPKEKKMNQCALRERARGLVRRYSEASARDTAKGEAGEVSGGRQAIPCHLWRLLLRQGGSHSIGFSVYKHHCGSYKENESEPHGPPVSPSFRNPNFMCHSGFPSKPAQILRLLWDVHGAHSNQEASPTFKLCQSPMLWRVATWHTLEAPRALLTWPMTPSARSMTSHRERPGVHSSDAPTRSSTGLCSQYTFTGQWMTWPDVISWVLFY